MQETFKLETNQLKYLSIEEAASYLRTTKSWIYQNHKTLRIPSYRLNRQLIFKAEDLDAWLETRLNA